MRVLVGYAQYTDRLSYYDDWRDAFINTPQIDVITLNIIHPSAGANLRRQLREVDAVVLLHSTNGDTISYLEPHVAALADRSVPLLTFVGNEVNLPGSPIAEKRKAFAAFRPEFIATQLLIESGRYLFGDGATRDVGAIPHALNPRVFQPPAPADARRLDIGARAARYLPHLGDDDRNRLMLWFATNGPIRGLHVDISDQRLNRDSWASYLNDCKATVSTEAGTWFLERDDTTVNAIR